NANVAGRDFDLSDEDLKRLEDACITAQTLGNDVFEFTNSEGRKTVFLTEYARYLAQYLKGMVGKETGNGKADV
ncbi:MAG: hypothetical protein DRI61_15120, partial [Chloroflexi bacterium]